MRDFLIAFVYYPWVRFLFFLVSMVRDLNIRLIIAALIAVMLWGKLVGLFVLICGLFIVQVIVKNGRPN